MASVTDGQNTLGSFTIYQSANGAEKPAKVKYMIVNVGIVNVGFFPKYVMVDSERVKTLNQIVKDANPDDKQEETKRKVDKVLNLASEILMLSTRGIKSNLKSVNKPDKK